MLGVYYSSPTSLSKGLILRDAYRRMELGLQPDTGCVAIFRGVLNLYVAKVALSRVTSGGSSRSWESKRGCGLLYRAAVFLNVRLSGGCTGEEIKMQQY